MSLSLAVGRGGRLLAGAVALATAATLAGAPAALADPVGPKKPLRLTLLHNNDAESKLLTGDSIADYGGIGRFKTVLDGLRAQADAYSDTQIASGDKRKGTVMVSSGDNFLAGLNLSASFAHGIPWYDSVAFDALDYDAATLGNHEFDFGPNRLADFIEGTTDVPFLSANLDFSREPRLDALADAGRIAPSTIVEVGADRVGVIGLTTPDIRFVSSPGKKITILKNLAAIANQQAATLTAAGVNKIILSSHLQGIFNEEALIPQLANIDIVIAGGGDELLANAGTPLIPGGTPVGPYPKQVSDKLGSSVPIVTTQGELRYVGRLTVEFNKQGVLRKIDTVRSGPVRVSGKATDPDVVARDPQLVTDVEQPLIDYKASLDANIIATSEILLNGGNPDPIRLKESNLGNLVTDAYLHAAGKAGKPADVALANGGGIRNSIVAGNVSEGQTFRVLPFDNIVVRVPAIPRSQFKELLENGYSFLPSANGRFTHVSGASVEVTTACTAQVVGSGGVITTAGSRVREVTLSDGTKIVDDGVVVTGDPIDVATVDFLAKGGDQYPFRGAPYDLTTTPYQQALEDFLVDAPAAGGLGGAVTAAEYPAGGEGRITISNTVPAGGC
ncbi:MAG: bifunctional UDP-sugar hydrolase/5'-nucleotidase [Baekduiaceae bacterium]